MTFKFQAVVTDVEEIPEEYRELYEESDGVHVLKMELVKDHPAIKTVKSTADKMDKEKRGLAKQLKELTAKVAAIPEDFDPDKYQELLDELTELREAAESGDGKKKKGDDGKELPSQIRALEQKLARAAKDSATEIKTRDDRNSVLSKKLERVLIDGGLTKALIEAGIDTKFLKATKAMLRDLVTLEEEDDDFRAMVETSDGGMVELDKFVADWAGTDEGKTFVKPASGAGADGGKGKHTPTDVNPFKAETKNITEQGRLVKEDPEKAKRLMKAAGWNDTKIASYMS